MLTQPSRRTRVTTVDPDKDGPFRIVLVTDAWTPQVNGVVTTLTKMKSELEKLGHEVISVTPDKFLTVPMPTYPEIRLALWPWPKLNETMEKARPHAIHIATEGPLGLAARHYCLSNNLPFSTSFHTRFPEYLQARTGAPLEWGYDYLRWFHGPSEAMMVSTPGLQEELRELGFGHTVLWPRGVDTELFRPMPEERGAHYLGLERPVYTYVGRVAVEKNIESFLDLDLPGTKMVVGDGPTLETLRTAYPDVRFTGSLFGEDLARAYAAADCFVFPSRTDTFGLVLLEALAAGTPVAAYPVRGPLDVIGDAPVGVLSENLGEAALKALDTSREACRQFALGYSWEICARRFESNLALDLDEDELHLWRSGVPGNEPAPAPTLPRPGAAPLAQS